MTNFIDLPELNVTQNQCVDLINFYRSQEHKLKANNHNGLNFLLIEEHDKNLRDLASRINEKYFERIYFYSSWESVKPHIDKRRATIISIPLINEDNIPASFHDGNVYYKGAVLFNTQKEHWVINTKNSFRLFVQIELKHGLTIDQCKELYDKGELINENNRRYT